MSLKKKKSSLIVFIFLIAILIGAGIYFGFRYFISGEEIMPIDVRDGCSIVLGNKLSSVKDQGACESKCRGGCESNLLSYHSFEFIEKADSCNECKCYCKNG